MNVLFLCTSNRHRSRTAEELFNALDEGHEYKSAGLSYKYVAKENTTLCDEKMLAWADKVFVCEHMHIQRIQQYTGDVFISKIENLDIADVYSYFQRELVLALLAKCKF